MRAMRAEPQAQVPAAKNGVRLEHAVAVTDKLLTKNLAKTDRQELEKLKNTLAVLKIKGSLNPVEADILNDNFNALLKLMAKYNVSAFLCFRSPRRAWHGGGFFQAVKINLNLSGGGREY